MRETSKRRLSLTNSTAYLDLQRKLIHYSQQCAAELRELERKKMDVKSFMRRIQLNDEDVPSNKHKLVVRLKYIL